MEPHGDVDAQRLGDARAPVSVAKGVISSINTRSHATSHVLSHCTRCESSAVIGANLQPSSAEVEFREFDSMQI